MPTKGRKRKSPSDEGEEQKVYAVLKPRTHYVGEATIRKRWATLAESSQGKVRELLQAGERQTIMIHRDERRRLEAQHAVNEVQRRFSKRIPKIPFPPGTKNSHFDYESVLGSNRIAEAELTSTIHYNQLLRAETEKRERLLAAESMELLTVERNAKAEESLRKRQRRKLHPLLKNSELGHDESTAALPKLATKIAVQLDGDNDPTLQRLTQQLFSHLESMQSNTGQLEQVKRALPRTRALLEDLVT